MKTKVVLIVVLSAIVLASLSGQGSKKKVTIRGHVSDGEHNPVAGAVITVDSRKTDRTTGQNGSYRIKVEPSAEYIGIYTEKNGVTEEAINGRTTIDFTMPRGVNSRTGDQMKPGSGEEVNIGYGSVKKEDLTQPVNKVDGKGSKYASYTNIYEMIRSEVPGVRVNGTSINIQGASSFISSTQPLIVVDGVPTEYIDNISPQMVKSIEVLKGAAAAIYGSRGANGVILINLIGAKEGR